VMVLDVTDPQQTFWSTRKTIVTLMAIRPRMVQVTLAPSAWCLSRQTTILLNAQFLWCK